MGGDPPRALRLTEPGARTLRDLLSGRPPQSPARAALATRLLDAGLVHPRTVPAPADEVTVVIPVRDRTAQLDRCLSAVGALSAVVVDDGSADPGAVAAVCARHRATLMRRPAAGGPAAARNTGLTQVDTELIAFLDSDCVPAAGWLQLLCGVMADPAIGAAAPRIRPIARGGGAIARFAAFRSPLDLGPDPARVRPGGRISYAPTAALLVRRAALGAGFEPTLRYGEDVDLIWRMHDAGWIIRYEPAATVGHAEPSRFPGLARRRFAYGTAAGPLAHRHPGRLAPVWLHPRPATTVGLAVAGRPRLALLAAAAHVVLAVRALHRVGVSPAEALPLSLRGLGDSTTAIGRAATMLAPGALAVGLAHRRTRPAALGLLLAEPTRSWARARPQLDPARWAALAVADDLAYGAGVWVGAARARTLAPLEPAFRRRA